MTEESPPSTAAALPIVGRSPRVLGSLGEFNPKMENISSYLERLQLYFEANTVEEDRKVAVFLTVVGARTYKTLRSLLAPTLPASIHLRSSWECSRSILIHNPWLSENGLDFISVPRSRENQSQTS